MRHLNQRGDAGLEQLEARAEAECIEGGAQVAGVLAEMRPAIGVQGNDHGIGERARGLNGVVGIHGEMKRTAGLRRAGERQHHAGLETPRDFRHAVVPDRVTADVDRTAACLPEVTTKPMTSPDNGSIPAGPWRAGVAVIVSECPSRPVSSVVAQGARPSA